MGETPILGTPHFGNPLQWQVLPVIPGRPRGSSLELRTPGIGSAGADHEWSMMMSGWFMNGWLLIYLVDIYIYIIMYIYIYIVWYKMEILIDLIGPWWIAMMCHDFFQRHADLSSNSRTRRNSGREVPSAQWVFCWMVPGTTSSINIH